jgi:hypothetical protein
MGIQDRDYYRDKKSVNFNYNPKEFRGQWNDPLKGEQNSSQKSLSKINYKKILKIGAFVALLLIIFTVAMIAFSSYRSKGMVWKLVGNISQSKDAAPNAPAGLAAKKSLTDQKIAEIGDSKSKNKAICKHDSFAGDADISAFMFDSQKYLDKVSIIKDKVTENSGYKVKIQADMEVLSRESSAIVSFYNRTLVKCYLSTEVERDVSTRYSDVNRALADLNDSLK